MNIRSVTAIAAAAAALTMAAQARADVITFYLTQGECATNNCAVNPPPPPLAPSNTDAVKVVVTGSMGSLGDYTQATVEFIGLNNGATNVPGLAYINVNDGGVVANVTATVSVPGGTTRSDPGQSEDHFGNMNTWSSNNTAGTVTFTLTAVSPFSWTDAADVLMPTTGFDAHYGHGFEAVTSAQIAGVAPAPSIGRGLPGILAVAGVLFGAGLLERSRKRRSPGTAIPPAAA
jgi:hypothetical protein